MSAVMRTLGSYVKQSKPQPNLVIMEADLSNEEMEGLGFELKNGEYWVISRKDARAIFEPKQFDFEKHWKVERKLRQDAIPR